MYGTFHINNNRDRNVPLLRGSDEIYSHVHLAQVAVAVLDDVGVFGAVELGHRAAVALGSDVTVGRVHRHGHHVDAHVTDEGEASTLKQHQDANPGW